MEGERRKLENHGKVSFLSFELPFTENLMISKDSNSTYKIL